MTKTTTTIVFFRTMAVGYTTVEFSFGEKISGRSISYLDTMPQSNNQLSEYVKHAADCIEYEMKVSIKELRIAK